ncbi:MAG: hypothetical protein V4674_00610 [Patescibacteria group bacterium]
MMEKWTGHREKEKSKGTLVEAAREGEPSPEWWEGHVKAIALALAVGMAAEAAPVAFAETKEATPEKKTTVEVVHDAAWEARQEKLREFDKELKEHKTRAKVALIRDVCGKAIEPFLLFRGIKNDLKELHLLEEARKDPAHRDEVELEESLCKHFKERWTPRDQPIDTFTVKNVDKIEGLAPEAFTDFMHDTYPKKYIFSSVAGIEFIAEYRKDGVKGYIYDYSTRYVKYEKEQEKVKRAPITIYDVRKGYDKAAFLATLMHEMGHPNDWSNSASLTNFERIDMLTDVIGRLLAEDRFRSKYVENITIKELGLYHPGSKEKELSEEEKKQILFEIKTGEYWAEIQKEYFKDKEKFKEEHPEDYAVVDHWVGVIANR